MVYCVGLTGGIASGKSTAAKLFAELGIQIISADNLSRLLTAKNQTAYTQIVARYGNCILNEDKELNRKALRTIIFADHHERQWLEALLHPRIRAQIKEELGLVTTPYCIIEIPLLIDKNNYPYIQRVLLIQASKQIQIERIMQRDQCDEAHALSIIAAQPEEHLRLKNADDVIMNDRGIEELKTAITMLHYQYLQRSIN